MKTESGRSLIEIIGVIAITGVMTGTAIKIYQSIHHNQHDTIASAELRELAKNAKILMGMRGDYTGISVEYLIKSGAINSDKPPIGQTWSIDVESDRTSFSINFKGVERGDCEFFAAAVPTWAESMFVNGYRLDEYTNCFSGAENNISFIVR